MVAARPRLFGITARDVPVVAIIRRGPTEWCQVSRWNPDAGTIDHGSWFRGTIPPQKCDLSPDGVWLAYSAVKYPGRWEGGAVYQAISRLPWLTALAAWDVGSTYTRGAHFVDEGGRNDFGVPDHGSFELRDWGFVVARANQFAVERRRGWFESEDTAPRQAGGAFDEERSVEMAKHVPAANATLRVAGAFAAFRASPTWHEGLIYWIEADGQEIELADVQWADVNHDGRLLVATIDGQLQLRELVDGELITIPQHDLAGLEVDPQPPPAEAQQW